MRFAYPADEGGYRKAFRAMFPRGKLKASAWRGPPSAYAFHLDARGDDAAEQAYDLGMFLKDGDGIMAFHCASRYQDDSAFCTAAILRLSAKGWSELRPVPSDTTAFDFAGRTIEAGPACRFLAGRNYQCPGNGQLSWWEFGDSLAASAALRHQMQTTLGRKDVRLAYADTVECALEGKATSCVVNTYSVSSLDPRGMALPKLVAVYAQAEVRGREIGAVCSFYRDDAPTLCDEVLDLQDGFHPFLSPPGTAARKERPADSSFFTPKEGTAIDMTISMNHQAVGLLGYLIANPRLGFYSRMEPLGAYAVGKQDTSLGILSASFTGISLASMAFNAWKSDYDLNLFQKILFFSPYALHPEIWAFPFAKAKPYLGYSLDLVYGGGIHPIVVGRGGMVFDFLKSHSVRFKLGYEYYRYDSVRYSSFQVSVGAGIGDL